MKIAAISLHVRLAGLLFLMLCVAAAILFVDARHNARELAAMDIDSRLQQTAITLASASSGLLERFQNSGRLHDTRISGLIVDDSPGRSVNTPVFALRRNDGELVLRSIGFPEQLEPARPGFSRRTLDGQRWRIFSTPIDTADLIIQVAIDPVAERNRAEVFEKRLQQYLFWLFLALAIVGLLMLWRGLAPIRQLQRVLGQIDVHHPSPTGLSPAALPRELAGLVRVIDALLSRLGRVVERQRVFAAAANHEFRTPLAGCQSQVDFLRRTHDPSHREAALDRIDERITHMTHLAAQLQQLAEASQLGIDTRDVHLAPIVRQVIAMRHAQAHAKSVSLGATVLPDDIVVRGEPTLLQSLIDNLLGNAIEVAPMNTCVDVQLERQETSVWLRILDAGPGTRAHEERLFEPFFRVEKATPGTGLGLSIVHAVADAHGAEVWFDNTGPEHSVVVSWPTDNSASRGRGWQSGAL
ncbi:MAG: hypothetical protein CMP08_06495 [Xanthomonadales bacterium]|nr:hypothetical protein [Xanthomonadales bacterium]